MATQAGAPYLVQGSDQPSRKAWKDAKRKVYRDIGRRTTLRLELMQGGRTARQQVFFFDPFFGFVFPGVIGVNQVLSRVTRNRPSGSIGAGWSVKLGKERKTFPW